MKPDELELLTQYFQHRIPDHSDGRFLPPAVWNAVVTLLAETEQPPMELTPLATTEWTAVEPSVSPPFDTGALVDIQQQLSELTRKIRTLTRELTVVQMEIADTKTWAYNLLPGHTPADLKQTLAEQLRLLGFAFLDGKFEPPAAPPPDFGQQPPVITATPQTDDASRAVAELRAVGLDAWDKIAEPAAFSQQEVRGEEATVGPVNPNRPPESSTRVQLANQDEAAIPNGPPGPTAERPDFDPDF